MGLSFGETYDSREPQQFGQRQDGDTFCQPFLRRNYDWSNRRVCGLVRYDSVLSGRFSIFNSSLDNFLLLGYNKKQGKNSTWTVGFHLCFIIQSSVGLSNELGGFSGLDNFLPSGYNKSTRRCPLQTGTSPQWKPDGCHKHITNSLA